MEIAIVALTLLFFTVSPFAVYRRGKAKDTFASDKLADFYSRTDVLAKHDLLCAGAALQDPSEADDQSISVPSSGDIRSIMPSMMYIPIRRARRLPKVHQTTTGASDRSRASRNVKKTGGASGELLESDCSTGYSGTSDVKSSCEEYRYSTWYYPSYSRAQSQPNSSRSGSIWGQWWRKDDAWDGWWKKQKDWNGTASVKSTSGVSKDFDGTTEASQSHWTNWKVNKTTYQENPNPSESTRNSRQTSEIAETNYHNSTNSQPNDVAGWRAIRAAMRRERGDASKSSKDSSDSDVQASSDQQDDRGEVSALNDPWFLWKSNRAQQELLPNSEERNPKQESLGSDSSFANTKMYSEIKTITKDDRLPPIPNTKNQGKKLVNRTMPREYFMGIGARELHNAVHASALGARLM